MSYTKLIAAHRDPETGAWVPQQEVPYTADEIAARQEEEAAWEAGAVAREAMTRIREIESSITSRRIREAALTEEGRLWLEARETEIAEERAKL